jgi:5,10-methylenetetrahydrofolate reductase
MAKNANKKVVKKVREVEIRMPMAAAAAGRRTVIWWGLMTQTQRRLKDLARVLGVAIPKYKEELANRLVERLEEEEEVLVVVAKAELGKRGG